MSTSEHLPSTEQARAHDTDLFDSPAPTLRVREQLLPSDSEKIMGNILPWTGKGMGYISHYLFPGRTDPSAPYVVTASSSSPLSPTGVESIDHEEGARSCPALPSFEHAQGRSFSFDDAARLPPDVLSMIFGVPERRPLGSRRARRRNAELPAHTLGGYALVLPLFLLRTRPCDRTVRSSGSPPKETTAMVLQGRSFTNVMQEVSQRADQMLPDRVVHFSDLSMTPQGHLVAPGSPSYRMNDHSRKQLSAVLGVRWRAWFDKATPEERAEEVTRRLARTPGELKIRAWKDDTGEADGIARAFLASSFTPIDDLRIMERLGAMLRGGLDEYLFTRVHFTEATSHFTAVHVEGREVCGDVLHPGWSMRNSEVGASALTLDDYWFRLACTNGLLIQMGGKRLLYRTHRHIDDDHLAAALVIALGKLPERWTMALALMQQARTTHVPHPDAAVSAILDSPEVPKVLVEEAQALVLRDADHTRFGVVQAITYVAHASNKDPDIRFAMERLAGDYLTAAELAAA